MLHPRTLASASGFRGEWGLPRRARTDRRGELLAKDRHGGGVQRVLVDFNGLDGGRGVWRGSESFEVWDLVPLGGRGVAALKAGHPGYPAP